MGIGNPRFCIRLSEKNIEALKELAKARHTTPSDIVRDLTLNELKAAGYSVDPKGRRGKKLHKNTA